MTTYDRYGTPLGIGDPVVVLRRNRTIHCTGTLVGIDGAWADVNESPDIQRKVFRYRVIHESSLEQHALVLLGAELEHWTTDNEQQYIPRQV